ncbi:YcjX family protein [Marinibaculum pumilum]|uniref:YcjX family protein n=1 Tax=Marinibaculum pumilum TaxID=1766165 RepID=A0ABV7L4I3_9PROT
MTVLDRLGRQIDNGLEAARDGVEQAFQQNLRIGVTGLARAGKTVFITSLLRNLLHRDRLPGLHAVAEGRIEAARLNPQPDLTLPRFPFEAHLAMLAGDDPAHAQAQGGDPAACWPPGTTNISEIRLSLRYRPGSWLARQFGETRTLHLDIVDYPGEWLLDLTLLRLDYAEWSARLLADAQSADARPAASAFLAAMAQADPEAEATDAAAEALAQPFRRYLQIRRENAGAPLAMTPGRFLLPGDLAGSPVLTFAPLPDSAGGGSRRNSLRALMARRYEGYRRQVVEPFLREQFGRLNRQIVLVDTLSALAAGGARLDQLSQALDEVLQVFRHGRPSWLSRLFAPRIDRIAFCATKADHVPDPLRPDLRRLTENLCFGSSNRIRYEGAETAVFALAAIAATGEAWREVGGERRRCVAGPAEGYRGTTLFFPGAIPTDPAAPAARTGFDGPVPRFLPPPGMVAAGRGLPHLNMDHMLQFLIGDALT